MFVPFCHELLNLLLNIDAQIKIFCSRKPYILGLQPYLVFATIMIQLVKS